MELALFPHFLFLVLFLFRCSVEVFCIFVSVLICFWFFFVVLSGYVLVIWQDKAAVTENSFLEMWSDWKEEVWEENKERANGSCSGELRSVKQTTKKAVKGP